jgi:hypothetical protein
MTLMNWYLEALFSGDLVSSSFRSSLSSIILPPSQIPLGSFDADDFRYKQRDSDSDGNVYSEIVNAFHYSLLDRASTGQLPE